MVSGGSAPGSAVSLSANVNAYNVSHLYLLDLAFASSFDVFHCELCGGLLLKRCSFSGASG